MASMTRLEPKRGYRTSPWHRLGAVVLTMSAVGLASCDGVQNADANSAPPRTSARTSSEAPVRSASESGQDAVDLDLIRRLHEEQIGPLKRPRR